MFQRDAVQIGAFHLVSDIGKKEVFSFNRRNGCLQTPHDLRLYSTVFVSGNNRYYCHIFFA